MKLTTFFYLIFVFLAGGMLVVTWFASSATTKNENAGISVEVPAPATKTPGNHAPEVHLNVKVDSASIVIPLKRIEKLYMIGVQANFSLTNTTWAETDYNSHLTLYNLIIHIS